MTKSVSRSRFASTTGGLVALACAFALLGKPSRASADFSGDYNPSKFTLANTNANGSVNTGGAPASIALTGGNNGSGASGTTTFTLTLPASGNVTFNWAYTTADIAPQFDPAGYTLNGVFTRLTSNILINQTGSLVLAVVAGQVFGFEVNTTDNQFGAGTFSVSNFLGPVAAPLVPVAAASTKPVTIELINAGAIFSTLESGLPLAAAQREMIFNATRTATRDVGGRLFALRAGLSLGDDANPGVAGPTGRELVHRGVDGKDAKDSKEVPSDFFRHLEFYAAGDFGSYDIDDQGPVNGQGQDVWVGTAGAEYRVNQHVAFGLAGSYINSSTEISKQIGSTDVEGAAVSAYGSAVWKAFYVDALYSFGTFQNDIHRHTLVGREATGSAESHTNSVQLNTGYTFKLGGLHTGPMATLDWVHGDLHGYSEHGGGSAALDYEGQHFDSLISRLGWQLSYTVPIPHGTITPQIRASWDHEYLDSSDSVGASLQNSPFATITGTKVTTGGKFGASMETANPGRDYLNVGAGFAVQLNDRWSASLDYETHIFQDSETVHLASAKVSVSF